MELLDYLKTKFADENINRKDDDIVQLAVELGYADMSRRANGHKEVIKQECVKYLVDEIKKYTPEEKHYDEWHKERCIELKQKISESAKKHGLSFVGTIGRAQKVINMSFKYLLVLDKTGKYDCIKNELHMALDSYTLKWYNSIKPKDNKSIERWNGIDSYDEYMQVQNTIRALLSDNYIYVPKYTVEIENEKKCFNSDNEIPLPDNVFEAEFIIWEGEKNKVVYKDAIRALASTKKDRWFIDKTLDDYFKQLIN